MASSSKPVMTISPGSADLSIAMFVTPVSSMSALIVEPPAPITLPTFDGSIIILRIRGTAGGSAAACEGIASFISPRM